MENTHNMLNKEAKLSDKTLEKESLESAPTRDGFGNGVTEAGKSDKDIVVLCADLADSTRASWFRDKYPDRYIELGVAEQNLAALAAGMALAGKTPFIASYATFSPGRNNEQIRTLISLQNTNVKVCGMHAGVSVGPDGATHQALEDIALMRVQPNMTVLVPADAEEARKATIAAARHTGPVYIRFGREATPLFTTENTSFEIGKAYEVFRSANPKIGIIASGSLVHNAILAAEHLEKEGMGAVVLNNHTVKPLDAEKIVALAKEVEGIVTVEEHQVAGGMGSAVAELLAKEQPTKISFIGVQDRFGQSGEPDELIRYYGMDADSIASVAKNLLK